VNLLDGQCGLCAHFGEHHPERNELIQIRKLQKAPDNFIDRCGHPKHADLHLKVSAISGCDGFLPATHTY
jgi:hypothetical protein